MTQKIISLKNILYYITEKENDVIIKLWMGFNYDENKGIERRIIMQNVKIEVRECDVDVVKFGEDEIANIVFDGTAYRRSLSMMTKTDHGTYTFEIPEKNSRGENFKVELRSYATQAGTDEKVPVETYVDVLELKKMYEEYVQREQRPQAEKQTEEKESNFVGIKISKKRFAGEPWKTDEMKEAYQNIFVSEGYTYSRPLSKIHDIKEDNDHVMLYFPVKLESGTEYKIRLTKSEKNAEGEYSKTVREVTSKELALLYECDKKIWENKRAEAAEDEFVEIRVSKKQVVGEPWSGNDGVERRNILAPAGYQFSRKTSQLHEIEDDKYRYKLFFPKKNEDGSDYEITLVRSVKLEDGTYDDETRKVTPDVLKEEYEQAREMFKQKSRVR